MYLIGNKLDCACLEFLQEFKREHLLSHCEINSPKNLKSKSWRSSGQRESCIYHLGGYMGYYYLLVLPLKYVNLDTKASNNWTFYTNTRSVWFIPCSEFSSWTSHICKGNIGRYCRGFPFYFNLISSQPKIQILVYKHTHTQIFIWSVKFLGRKKTHSFQEQE